MIQHAVKEAAPWIDEVGPKPAPASRADDGPFPGLLSYDYDRRDSFLGRKTEIHDLTAMVLGRRFTVLTAGSGDGKTSLIHAGIAPLLMHDGIEVAVAEPGLGGIRPLEAFRELCMSRLCPDAETLVGLIDRLTEALDPKACLDDVRKHCRALSSDELKELLLGRRSSRPVDLLHGGALATWMRDSRVPSEYAAMAMKAMCPADSIWRELESTRSFGSLTLGDLRDRIASSDGTLPLPATAYGPTPALSANQLLRDIEAVVTWRRKVDPDFEFVLILDQFEEVFLRFVGEDGAPLRDEILKFTQGAIRRRWPVHVMLSLRKEHYADLQAAMSDAVSLEPSTYHLQPLSIDQAETCLADQKIWPVDATPENWRQQVTSIVAEISVDKRFVYPVLLSIVGQYIWQHRDDSAALATDAMHQFVSRALEHHCKAIFFAAKSAGGNGWTATEQHEVLDILDQLTLRDAGRFRRDSVSEEALLRAPLRNRQLRNRLLSDLRRSYVVRWGERVGSNYAEIVHECLLPELHKLGSELRNRDPVLADFPALIDELRTEAQEPPINVRPVPRRLLPVLLENVSRLSLPPGLAIRLFVRLLADPGLLDDARRKPVRSPDGEVLEPKRVGQLRALLVNLDLAAAGPMPERRKPEDGLFLPEEADLRAATPTLERQQLEMLLASALLHHDAGAAGRIRQLADKLTEVST